MCKRLILGFAVALLFVPGCHRGGPHSPRLDYRLPPTRHSTDRIRYLVEGGGNIDFTIAPSPGSFAVHVARYDYKRVDIDFSVDKSVTDPAIVALLDSLFQGAINIGGTLYRGAAPTGTWTYLYIGLNDDWLRVANATVIDGAHSFARLVRAHLDQDSP